MPLTQQALPVIGVQNDYFPEGLGRPRETPDSSCILK